MSQRFSPIAVVLCAAIVLTLVTIFAVRESFVADSAKISSQETMLRMFKSEWKCFPLEGMATLSTVYVADQSNSHWFSVTLAETPSQEFGHRIFTSVQNAWDSKHIRVREYSIDSRKNWLGMQVPPVDVRFDSIAGKPICVQIDQLDGGGSSHSSRSLYVVFSSIDKRIIISMQSLR